MPNLVHDIVRHPIRDGYASGKAEFRAVTIRDDGGETISKAVSVAKFKKTASGGLAAGEFSIDLPEGPNVENTGSGLITDLNVTRVVVPTSGYTVELNAASANGGRGILATANCSALTVLKISDETS